MGSILFYLGIDFFKNRSPFCLVRHQSISSRKTSTNCTRTIGAMKHHLDLPRNAQEWIK